MLGSASPTQGLRGKLTRGQVGWGLLGLGNTKPDAVKPTETKRSIFFLFFPRQSFQSILSKQIQIKFGITWHETERTSIQMDTSVSLTFILFFFSFILLLKPSYKTNPIMWTNSAADYKSNRKWLFTVVEFLKLPSLKLDQIIVEYQWQIPRPESNFNQMPTLQLFMQPKWAISHLPVQPQQNMTYWRDQIGC